jgi:hypothetical protein
LGDHSVNNKLTPSEPPGGLALSLGLSSHPKAP